MTDEECLDVLRKGLVEYCNTSWYVPQFKDALEHAIKILSELIFQEDDMK